MQTEFITTRHAGNEEEVRVIKVTRDEGISYIVFWDGDPIPTVYSASEYLKTFDN
jgi:hypothetical protein